MGCIEINSAASKRADRILKKEKEKANLKKQQEIWDNRLKELSQKQQKQKGYFHKKKINKIEIQIDDHSGKLITPDSIQQKMIKRAPVLHSRN